MEHINKPALATEQEIALLREWSERIKLWTRSERCLTEPGPRYSINQLAQCSIDLISKIEERATQTVVAEMVAAGKEEEQ